MNQKMFYIKKILFIFFFQTFGLLDKRSFKIPGIRDFSWSPSDNVLAYWVAENKDVPARVTLLEIPRYFFINYINYYFICPIRFF